MHSLIALIALPLLFFIPGFVTLRVPLFRLAGQPDATDSVLSRGLSISTQPVSLVEAVGLSVAVSFLLSSLVAFALVILGIFSLWILMVVLSVYVFIVSLLTRKQYRTLAFPRALVSSHSVITAVGLIVLVLMAFAMYSRYNETILVFRDPATQTNTGINIAKTGTSFIDDPLYYSFPDKLQRALVYERPVDAENRLGGFQVEYRLRGFPRDAKQQRTVPQFFNLFPTWQAIGYSMFGTPGVFLVSPFFGALSVLFIFLVGCRLFGIVAGSAAAVLLTVNLAHLWFAKTAASETMFQTTFLIAILCWLLFSITRARLLGIFSGIAFGTLFLIRIDAVVIIGAIAAFLLYLGATQRIGRRDLFFILPLFAVTVLGLVDALYSSRPYTELVYRVTPQATTVLGICGIIAVAMLAVGAFPRLGLGLLVRSLEAKNVFKVRLVLVMGLVALAIFAYFVRPAIQDTQSWSGSGYMIPWHAEDTFVRLGWYLSPVGLILATIGAAIAVATGTGRAMFLFLVTTLSVTFYYMIDLRVWPDHFWAARRYVPVIIPMSLLFIGLVAQSLGWGRLGVWSPSWSNGTRSQPLSAETRLGRLRLRHGRGPGSRWLKIIRWLGTTINRQVLAVALLGALFALSVIQIWGFIPYRDQEGTVRSVENLAQKFPEDAIIVFDNSTLGDILAPSLKLIHGRETFVIGPPGVSDSYHTLCDADSEYPSVEEPRSCILAELVARSEQRPFFWVSPKGGEQPRIVRERSVKMDGSELNIGTLILEQPFDRLPTRSGVGKLRFKGDIYWLNADRATSPTRMAAQPVSPNSIGVTWSYNGSNVVLFELERKKGSRGKWEKVATQDPAARAFLDTGLVPPDRRWYYRARSMNCNSEPSAWSDVVYAATNNQISRMGSWRALDIAEPIVIGAVTVSPACNIVTWSYNSKKGVKYELHRKKGSRGSWERVAILNSTTKAYMDRGLTPPDRRWHYRIRPIDLDGAAAAWSEEVSTSTPPWVAVPIDIHAEAMSPSDIKITLSYNSGNKVRLELQRKKGARGKWKRVAVLDRDTRSYLDTGLSPPERWWYYRVRAVDAANGQTTVWSEVAGALTHSG